MSGPPVNTARQQFNAYRIQRLLMAGGLTAWERSFVDSVSGLKKPSPRQKATLDNIFEARAS